MKTIPVRTRVEPLAQCEGTTKRGTRCRKHICGFEALKKHGLLAHLEAGRRCYTCLIGFEEWRRRGNAASVVANKARGLARIEALEKEAEAAVNPSRPEPEAPVVVIDAMAPVETASEPVPAKVNLYTADLPAVAYSPLLSIEQRKRLVLKAAGVAGKPAE